MGIKSSETMCWAVRYASRCSSSDVQPELLPADLRACCFCSLMPAMMRARSFLQSQPAFKTRGQARRWSKQSDTR